MFLRSFGICALKYMNLIMLRCPNNNKIWGWIKLWMPWRMTSKPISIKTTLTKYNFTKSRGLEAMLPPPFCPPFVEEPVSYCPRISMASSLKNTKVKLDLLTYMDMLLMVEISIRGWICHAIYRYVIANNKYMSTSNKK